VPQFHDNFIDGILRSEIEDNPARGQILGRAPWISGVKRAVRYFGERPARSGGLPRCRIDGIARQIHKRRGGLRLAEQNVAAPAATVAIPFFHVFFIVLSFDRLILRFNRTDIPDSVVIDITTLSNRLFVRAFALI
jgi:hypothetical protein